MKPDRFFYTAAGAIFLVLIVLGFQQYIFHGKHVDGSPIAPVMLAIVVAHSTAIFLWFVGFFVQALLISTHNRRVHRSLGWGVVGIAALIVVTGPLVATRSVQVDSGAGGFRLAEPAVSAGDVYGDCAVRGVRDDRRAEPQAAAHSQADDADGLAGDCERSDGADRAGWFDLRGSPLDGDLWAGGDAGIAAAGGARGDDAELRSAVCDGAGRDDGGDAGGGKAGDDERVGGLGGDDFEAVRGVVARAREVRAPRGAAVLGASAAGGGQALQLRCQQSHKVNCRKRRADGILAKASIDRFARLSWCSAGTALPGHAVQQCRGGRADNDRSCIQT